jgi:hypothetical protein
MIDPKTFGGTYAGEILARRLNGIGKKKLTRRVSAYLHHTFKGFAELASIEDDKLFEVFVVLWRNDRTSKVNFYDDNMNSLIRSIIVACSRSWLRGEASWRGGEETG